MGWASGPRIPCEMSNQPKPSSAVSCFYFLVCVCLQQGFTAWSS